MKKIILCSVLIFTLAVGASCGRFQNTAGGGAVSGRSVSGEAVSGEAVSGQDTDRKMDEKEIEEMVVSWYQNNHYMYDSSDEKQYSCRCDDTAFIYGEECYLAILYYKGYSIMFFAVNKETGEIFYNCADNIFIPLNRVKILGDSNKDEKEANSIMKKIFGKKKARKMAYFEPIERDGIKYFEYGEFESSELQLVYLLDIKTGEIYNWDLSEDVLNKYINS